MAFNLPRLKSDLAIVDPSTGKPTRAFEALINLQILGPLESAIIDIQQNVADLQAAFAAIQAVSAVAQAAVQAANQAQETADQAGGGTATSGYQTQIINPSGVSFVPGPQVDLTGVVAGDLTITGSGPQQDDSLSAPVNFSGQWQIVEIVGVTETVVFTGDYQVYAGTPSTVLNQSAASVSAFVSARSSTGAVSYRLDVNRTDGGPITTLDLSTYIFVRRA